MLKTGLYLTVLLLGVAHSLVLFGDPCNVYPDYGGIPDSSDFTTSVHVPKSCKNGTFRWDYPKGHVMLHVSNAQHQSISVCIRDSLGGDVFEITDITDGRNSRIEHFTFDKYVCTQGTASRDIVLKIDAPAEQRYMGAVDYNLQIM